MDDARDELADEHAGPVHGADDQSVDQGHDDHVHDEEPLGPPDIGLWAAGAGGIAVAIVIAACFAFSTGAL